MKFSRTPVKTALRPLLLMGIAMAISSVHTQAQDKDTAAIQVTAFLPDGHVTDGSIGYQAQIQQAIDSAATTGGEIVFAPMIYRITNPTGLRLHSDLTLRMEGATFLIGDECDADGQLFLGRDVSNLRFQGGTIAGSNEAWPDGVNIRGIHLIGECKNIRIRDMRIRDLSSNGIGIFAEDADHPATDIWVLDTIIVNCSNKFGDYQAPANRGPEKGSTREDQGLVAMYHVHDFTVRGCRLENSRSDGTHFFFCRRGRHAQDVLLHPSPNSITSHPQHTN